MALANLVLADGQGSPANHTFSYEAEVPNAIWTEKASGIPIGFPKITIQQSRPTQARKSVKTSIKIATPVLEVISGDVEGYTAAPKVAYTLLFEGHFVAPDRSTLQNRKDLTAFVQNLLGKAMVVSMLNDLAPAA